MRLWHFEVSGSETCCGSEPCERRVTRVRTVRLVALPSEHFEHALHRRERPLELPAPARRLPRVESVQDERSFDTVPVGVLEHTRPELVVLGLAVGDVAAWETMLATAIILAATYGLVRFGGAVYSGSLLRTGARPRLRDVWSAARAR